MKVILIFMLFFPLYLLSEEPKVINMYEKGLTYYKNQDFKGSYTLFSKIYLQHLSDIEFNFYFGRSAYETGHYEMALAAFERVEMQDSANVRNRLEMARTYFMLKMYEDAENMFRDVLENPTLPDDIRVNIELVLSTVSKVQQKSFTYVTGMIDIFYDSNINYGSINDYYYGGAKLVKIENISDTALQTYAKVLNIYDIGDKSGFFLKNSISAYMKDYTGYDNYDIGFLSYVPSLLYRETHFTAELLLGLDRLFLGKEEYLSTIYIEPRFEFNHSSITRSIISLKYQSKKFEQDKHSDLDADRYAMVYGLQHLLSPRSFIQTNVMLATERKDGGDDIYVDFDEFKTDIKYTNQFNKEYNLNLFAHLRGRSYKDYSQGFQSTRKELGGFGSAEY